jgi:hypothetical protein
VVRRFENSIFEERGEVGRNGFFYALLAELWLLNPASAPAVLKCWVGLVIAPALSSRAPRRFARRYCLGLTRATCRSHHPAQPPVLVVEGFPTFLRSSCQPEGRALKEVAPLLRLAHPRGKSSDRPREHLSHLGLGESLLVDPRGMAQLEALRQPTPFWA